MKNLYLYLAGMVLLASGYFIVTDTKYSAYEALYQNTFADTKKGSQKSTAPKQLLLSPLMATKARSSKAAAESITAANSYQITKDLGAPGATAGDEITYTVTIANSGTAVNNISYISTIDTNTTLVAGSVIISPLANDESYEALGNVSLNIPAAGGLLANDRSPDGTALTLTGGASITTTQGGAATIVPETGAFTYDPPAGYTGKDTLNYTIQNASGLSMEARAIINITKRIWFINAAASGTSIGTLANPFTSIASFQEANTGKTGKPGINDYIFIYAGNYSGAITLLSGQKLIGQAVTGNLQTIADIAVIPYGSAALPSTGGAAPVLSTTGSSVDAITLNQNNTIRGLNIANTSGRKIKGSSFGKITVNEVQLTGNGAALDLTSGELDITLSTLSSASTGNAAIRLAEVSGSLTNTSGTISATNAPAIQISKTTVSPKLTLGLNFTAVSSSGTAKGISVSNTSGKIYINGTGTAGSGGTIRDITQRGVEFTNVADADIKLQFMNFTNANTTDGVGGIDNTNSNGAIYASNVNNLRLDNIAVSGTTKQYGLNLKNISSFSITNSSILNCGDSPEDGGIFATNITGTNTISNSVIGQSAGRGAYFRNNTGTLSKLTISNLTISDTPNAQALLIESWQNAVMNVIVKDNSQFLRCQTTGIAVYANEQSTNNADITGCTMDPGTDVGTGIDLAGSGTSKINFNVTGNTVKARSGTAINAFALESSVLEGTIQANTVSSLGGEGAGIAVRTEGIAGVATVSKVKINNNTINGITLDNAINVSAFSLSKSTLNATITNNNINDSNRLLMSTIDLSLTAVNQNNATLCADILSNTVSAVSTNSAGLLRINAPAGTTVLLPQTGSLIDIWNNNNNKPTGTSAGNTYVRKTGAGAFSTGTCATPANQQLRVAAEEAIATNTPVQTQSAPETDTVVKNIQPEEIRGEYANQTGASTGALRIEASNVEAVIVGGLTIPAGKSITIKYRVTVNSIIPANVCQLSNQGTITGSGIAPILTDNPAVSGSADPTSIPVTPTQLPTITQQPINSIVCAGTAASFSVTATETGLSYQWQKKTGSGAFTNITLADNATANSAMLTLTNVQTTDDATQYQVIVYTPCATITTGFATLTVNKITSATITGTASADQNDPMPVITFNAQGGTKPYTFIYTVNGEQKTVQTTGTASTAVASQPTTAAGDFVYELTGVTDAASCGFTPETPQSITINVTPLPVILTVFSAKKEENAAMLTWETTMEANSDRFEIERSTDGKNWFVIGTKTAGGESSTTLKYSFTDAEPVSGENLYRLKMIDRDQTFAYSRIRSLTFDTDVQTLLYPNPVSDKLHFNIADWNKVSEIELFSVKGQSVYKSGKSPKPAIDVTQLAGGMYVVAVRYTDGSSKAYRIVINR